MFRNEVEIASLRDKNQSHHQKICNMDASAALMKTEFQKASVSIEKLTKEKQELAENLHIQAENNEKQQRYLYKPEKLLVINIMFIG